MRKVLTAVVSILLVLFLSGCDFFVADTAELLSPPAFTGDLKPIAEAIKESAGGVYTLKYPSRGLYRSAVVQEDINSDGIFEAFAFYSMVDGETITMNINAITFKDGKWQSVATQKIVAGGVDKISFCDLDGDGVKEILVGWQIYGTSEMQLAVYSVSENALTQRMLQKYTHFITCDLDENGKNEVLIIKTASAQQLNQASLFTITQDGVMEISTCMLDSTVKTVNEPIVDVLSTGKTAVYIDEIKGVGAITEVLFMEKGTLVNPLLQVETGETLATLRSISFNIKDINNDGIIEIPVQENVPSVTRSEVNEKLYLTGWYSFNGEKLINQMTTMINMDDGYYFIIPTKWLGNIAVLKDTDNHLREIYRYNPEDMTVGESLMYFKTVKKRDFDDGKYNAAGISEIVNNGESSFICSLSAAAVSDGVTLDTVKAGFKLLE